MLSGLEMKLNLILELLRFISMMIEEHFSKFVELRVIRSLAKFSNRDNVFERLFTR